MHPCEIFTSQVRALLYSLNRYNSAADCSISLGFGTELDYVTTDKRSRSKVKGSAVKRNQERISWPTSNWQTS